MSRPPKYIWTFEEIDYLKRNFSLESNIELGRKLNKPAKLISYYLSKLGLRRPEDFRSKIQTGRSYRWTPEQISFLIKNFSSTPDKKLAESLNKEVSSVQSKARRLGLKKTVDYMNSMLKLASKKYFVRACSSSRRDPRNLEKSVWFKTS